jgi:hypothetical protein
VIPQESGSTNHDPPHEELVRHLVRCMEDEGLEIEAADAPGHPKPKPVKRSLRPERSRPDVVARDRRRTVFGEALSVADIGESYIPEKLATLAQKCRLLVICVPESVAQQAIEKLFSGERMPHRPKMRLLRHPRAKWEEPPKQVGSKKPRGPDIGPHVVVQR